MIVSNKEEKAAKTEAVVTRSRTRHEEGADALILLTEYPTASGKVLPEIGVINATKGTKAGLPQAQLQELCAIEASIRGQPVGRNEGNQGRNCSQCQDGKDRDTSI